MQTHFHKLLSTLCRMPRYTEQSREKSLIAKTYRPETEENQHYNDFTQAKHLMQISACKSSVC